MENATATSSRSSSPRKSVTTFRSSGVGLIFQRCLAAYNVALSNCGHGDGSSTFLIQRRIEQAVTASLRGSVMRASSSMWPMTSIETP